jgi:hypothetical protein
MPKPIALSQLHLKPLELQTVPIVAATMLDIERSAVRALRVDYYRTRDQFTYGSDQWIRADGRIDAINQILEMDGQ